MGPNELSGKVAVITGASMGIGEAVARVFADHGANVVLLSRDAGRAEAARQHVGHTERTVALACDVRNREEIDRVVGLTMHHFNRIDIWINNAGRGHLGSLANVEMAAVRDTFETNLFGAMGAMQAVIPIMKQQGGGAIINISSVAGHIPLPYHSVYSGTKFALNAIGKGSRIELKKYGINVLTVCPGYVRTDFGANAVRRGEYKQVRPSTVRGISPERVARAVLRGYLQRKREVVVPWFMRPFIKLYQFFPGVVEWGMTRTLSRRE
ncbi:MAG TPA: SDR family NAD(P)-dependent oxidoreductase [Terriglobales bacterium]|nr:SDR family NAD(P)-dependent oxidoreductase [Terriglobales bacterium]